jgi:predicted O-methyltransferase YrrM
VQVFNPPNDVIDFAMEKLKQDGVIHSDARFNYEAEGGLRHEVTYRDYDLQFRLGRSSKVEIIIEAAREMLVSLKLISADANYSKTAFEALHSQVKKQFKGSWTSVTPVMERLIYMLTAVRRPGRLVELGCFWGNTLAWFAGPCVGPKREYIADKIYGIDIDTKMIELARENFAKLENSESVELIGEDAAKVLLTIDSPIDFIYLEAKDENNNSGYLEFLKQAYDKLPHGAWVIAHDSTAWGHQEDLKPYLKWVRDTRNFSESISFDVDQFGLELSVK